MNGISVVSTGAMDRQGKQGILCSEGENSSSAHVLVVEMGVTWVARFFLVWVFGKQCHEEGKATVEKNGKFQSMKS